MQYPYAEELDEKKAENLRMALAYLSKNKFPPCPVNYRIAYDHVAGKSAELSTVLKDTNEQHQLTQEQLWEIYQRFFVQDKKALEKIREEMRSIVSSLHGEFQRSGGELTGFSSELDHFSNKLDTADSIHELSEDVQQMIQGTQSAIASQKKFDAYLANLESEVQQLRREIDQIKEESMTDVLTGIANRRAFDEELQKCMDVADKKHTPLSLLLIDVDHFKKFNDTYGHLVGDKVLKYVAGILKNCVKGQDFAARYGGEEFAVILPQTSSIGAKVIAEQIRQSISVNELQNRTKGESYGKITASIGISQYSFDGDAGNLIGRSDEALYKAKQNGRNRVVAA